MQQGLIAAGVTAHVPRMGIEERAPEFQRGLIAGSKAMGAAIRALKPDLLVLMSAHWVSTFNWYLTAHHPHRGHCVADEAPDLLPGQPYQRPGDPRFATELAAALKAQGIPGIVNDSPHFAWDYATWVPLHYLDPDERLPVVTMPSVLCSDLDECKRVGAAVHEVAIREGRRTIFLASSALTHKVVRGPHIWPMPECIELDRMMIEMLKRGAVENIEAWLPDYVPRVSAEMGGRVIATLTGALIAMNRVGPLSGTQYGDYAQSSASGNVNVLLTWRR